MIVCNGCGLALSSLHATCVRCSGRGIERPTPLKGLLTPTQQRGSPDRWAQSYTAPSSGSSKREASPLNPVSTIDIPLDQSSETLARGRFCRSYFAYLPVYGSVLDPNVKHPACAMCNDPILPGHKLYLAPRESKGCVRDDVLCRKCYSGTFRLGVCELCRLPILGEREEGGPHVKGRCDVMWHGKCFVCTHCSLPLVKIDHMLLPSGAPSCLGCARVFDDGPAPGSSRLPKHELHTAKRSPMPRFSPPIVTRDTAIAIQANRQAVNDFIAIATQAAQVPPTTSGFRSENSTTCPSCDLMVGFFETGTLKGPGDTRWHSRCLRCGIGGKTGKGCGKQLDSAATMQNGKPVCRTCVMEARKTAVAA